MGTGNDLSRSFGWGPGYETESPLIPILNQIAFGKEGQLDRWNVHFETENRTVTMNNYYSVGIDAKIALGFHQQREKNPTLFKNRTLNKIVYGWHGTRELFSSAVTIGSNTTLEVDGEKIELGKKTAGLVILNLGYYASGTDIWHGSKTKKAALNSVNPNISEKFPFCGCNLKNKNAITAIQRAIS